MKKSLSCLIGLIFLSCFISTVPSVRSDENATRYQPHTKNYLIEVAKDSVEDFRVDIFNIVGKKIKSEFQAPELIEGHNYVNTRNLFFGLSFNSFYLISLVNAHGVIETTKKVFHSEALFENAY